MNQLLIANLLIGQTAVFGLRDIGPTDWEAKTLQSLQTRYQCLEAPYPHQTLDRYEFAMLLHQCLEQIPTIESQDQKTIARLQQDFAPQLHQLNQRINQLDRRIEDLQQFSTTSRLVGEVLFQLGDSWSDEDATEAFLGYRTRIDFETSFTGRDLLVVRIENLDIARLDRLTDTDMTRLGTDGESDGAGIEIAYDFAVGEQLQVVVGPLGVDLNDVAEVLNPFSSSSRGALSRFGRRDPATLRGPSGAGLGLQYRFNDQIQAAIAYTSDDAASPNSGEGLFGGSHSAIAQLLLEPDENLAIAFTYTHSYERQGEVNLMSATGSSRANNPFGDHPTVSDNLGVQFEWLAGDRTSLAGWFGYTVAQQPDGSQEATIVNGALIFAVEDWGIENSEAGIIIGVPPLVTQHDRNQREDRETSLHIEALYRIEINDNLEITPGVFVITNPDHSDRPSIWVGTIRTRFSF